MCLNLRMMRNKMGKKVKVVRKEVRKVRRDQQLQRKKLKISKKTVDQHQKKRKRMRMQPMIKELGSYKN